MVPHRLALPCVCGWVSGLPFSWAAHKGLTVFELPILQTLQHVTSSNMERCNYC